MLSAPNSGQSYREIVNFIITTTDTMEPTVSDALKNANITVMQELVMQEIQDIGIGSDYEIIVIENVQVMDSTTGTTTVSENAEPEKQPSTDNEDEKPNLLIYFLVLVLGILFCCVMGALIVLVRRAQLRRLETPAEDPEQKPSKVSVSAGSTIKDPRGTQKPINVIGFSFSGEAEELNRIYGAALLGNFWDLGKDGLKIKTKSDTTYFRNVEAAFQALKFPEYADLLTDLSGPDAAQCGQGLKCKEDWDYCGYGSDWLAMYACLAAKFSQNNAQTILCCNALLKTGDAFLVGHNSSSGKEWVWSNNSRGDGANWLGLQLMLIRDEMQQRKEPTWTKYIQDTCGIDLKTGLLQLGVKTDSWQTTVYMATQALLEQHANFGAC